MSGAAQRGAASRPAARRRATISGPTDAAGRQARQRAALILEVLAGVRTPTEAAGALGVSVPRYYGLEEQALAGLVQACAPRAPGRKDGGAGPARVASLEQALAGQRQECARLQSLLRSAQKALGLQAVADRPRQRAEALAAGKRAPRRPTVRARRAAGRLRAASGDGGGAPPESAAGADACARGTVTGLAAGSAAVDAAVARARAATGRSG